MQISRMDIPDILIIEPKVFRDDRGFFFESFQAKKFGEMGIPTNFVQDNHAGSSRGILRGLHYQIRQPQGKLIRVVSGKVFDVSVDIRKTSPTFGKCVGITLSAEDKQLVWIPAGFAHGYYVLSEWAEILYKATDYYNPESERSILWNDSELGIDWPLIDETPILSAKDARGIPFKDAETYD